MMKVLLTTDTVGGVWNYTVELARALADREVELVLAAMGGPLGDDQRQEVSSLANVRVYESRYKLMWMRNPWSDVKAAGQWLLEIARRTRPDIVHLNDYAHGNLPWNAPVLMVGHSCVLSWWEAVRGGEAPACWGRYREVLVRGLRGSHLVVAPTRTMLHTLEQRYGPLPRTQVIYNGRDRRCFTVAAKEPIILSAGRVWDEAKNIAALARIAPDLDWPVVVAGDANHPDGGRFALEGVSLLGRLSSKALAEWYARAAIYVLPARYEPFGLTPLEAAISGCALVLGDIATLRELWQDAACFIPPNDHSALKFTLKRLIADPHQRQEYTARARARALRMSARRMAAEYWEAYQGLLGQGRVAATSSPIPAEPCPPAMMNYDNHNTRSNL